jgi:hypothetical protein
MDLPDRLARKYAEIAAEKEDHGDNEDPTPRGRAHERTSCRGEDDQGRPALQRVQPQHGEQRRVSLAK